MTTPPAPRPARTPRLRVLLLGGLGALVAVGVPVAATRAAPTRWRSTCSARPGWPPSSTPTRPSGWALRVALEAPGDTWAARTMPGAGLLYEAGATGDYSYRGTEPASYDQVFDQESGDDDLTRRRQALRPVEGEDRAGRQANPLVTRFEAVADLKGLESTATARLRPDLYTGT